MKWTTKAKPAQKHLQEFCLVHLLYRVCPVLTVQSVLGLHKTLQHSACFWEQNRGVCSNLHAQQFLEHEAGLWLQRADPYTACDLEEFLDFLCLRFSFPWPVERAGSLARHTEGAH